MTGISARRGYHHGDLREALVAASHQLVVERGAENFSLADACRAAGVSTAAPYKHFRDRNEILEIVCQRGFDDLADQGVAAAEAHGRGTLDAVIAMNLQYVAFAVTQQAMFRLMFGQNPELKRADDVLEVGRSCFSKVVEQIAFYCEANNVAEDAMTVCIRNWSFIHGVASLVIDEDYECVMPGFDYEALVRSTTPLLLGGAGRDGTTS